MLEKKYAGWEYTDKNSGSSCFILNAEETPVGFKLEEAEEIAPCILNYANSSKKSLKPQHVLISPNGRGEEFYVLVNHCGSISLPRLKPEGIPGKTANPLEIIAFKEPLPID